jgi:beta-lactamase regulating signal transducer with metallopeptidase domain
MLLANIINPVTYAIAWTVVHSTWQILLIVLITAIIQSSMHKRTASTRYNVLVSASFLIALCSISTFGYLYQEALDLFSLKESVSKINTFNSNLLPPQVVLGHDASNDDSWGFRIMEYVNSNILLIIGIWIVGMVLALIKLVGNVSYVMYVKNNFNFPVDEYWSSLVNKISLSFDMEKKIELLESALVRSPIVVGFLKPMILFPIGAINRLDPSEVEAILAHELAHIKRNDFIINIIVSILESIYYYHPAMWWHTSQIRREREYCCDDMAIAYTGNKFGYAKSLVAVQEMALYSPSLAMAFANNENKNELLMRVNRLVQKTSKSINMKEKSIAGSFILLFLFSLLFAFKPALTGSQADCVPAENTSQYLTYNNNGNLDSLLLDFTVTDGDYSYSQENLEMKLTVKGRSVVAFNINGMDVPGADIIKFKDLINTALLDSPQGIEENNDESFKIYDQLALELKRDNLLTKDINKIILTDSKLKVNGLEMELGKYATYYNSIAAMTGKDAIEVRITSNKNAITGVNIEGDEVDKSNFSYSYTYSSDEETSQDHLMPPPPPPVPPTTNFSNFPSMNPPMPPAPPSLPELIIGDFKIRNGIVNLGPDVPNGIKVSLGDVLLKEGVDYKIDRKLGKLTIINPANFDKNSKLYIEYDEKDYEKALNNYNKKAAEYDKKYTELLKAYNIEVLRQESQSIKDSERAHSKAMEEHNKAIGEHNKSMKDHNKSMKEHEKEMKRHNEFRDKLVSLLITDDYIENKNDIKIDWKNNVMKVNGNQVKESDQIKYQELYKSFGWKIDKSFHYTATINND